MAEASKFNELLSVCGTHPIPTLALPLKGRELDVANFPLAINSLKDVCIR